MKLYYSPGACSLAPHILVHALKLEVTVERVNMGKKLTASGLDYFSISPKAAVPSLQLDNGEVLTEAAVVMQYLCDLKPEAALMPQSGTWERYRALEWLNFVATDLHKNFSPLFHADRLYSEKPHVIEAVKEGARRILAKHFTFVEGVLVSKPFLMGEGFTAADAYLLTVLRWARAVKVDLDSYPKLAGFLERGLQLPYVRQAMEAEGLKVL